MSDELATRLRELAEIAEMPAPGSGADVRATAGRRRRRRRSSAVVAGGCAAAALASFVTLSVASHGTEHRRSSAATAVPETTSAVPEATVDLSRRVLTVDGRALPVSAGTPETPIPTGLMTVTAKSATERVTGEAVGFGDAYEVKVRWVLELSPIEASATGGGDGTSDARAGDGMSDAGEGGDERGTGGTSAATGPSEPATGPGERGSGTATQRALPGALFIAALNHDEKAPGNNDTTPGWIGLRPTDAEWLYDRLAKGAIVQIREPAATPEPTSSLLPTTTATTATTATTSPTSPHTPVFPTARPSDASTG